MMASRCLADASATWPLAISLATSCRPSLRRTARLTVPKAPLPIVSNSLYSLYRAWWGLGVTPCMPLVQLALRGLHRSSDGTAAGPLRGLGSGGSSSRSLFPTCLASSCQEVSVPISPLLHLLVVVLGMCDVLIRSPGMQGVSMSSFGGSKWTSSACSMLQSVNHVHGCSCTGAHASHAARQCHGVINTHQTACCNFSSYLKRRYLHADG